MRRPANRRRAWVVIQIVLTAAVALLCPGPEDPGRTWLFSVVCTRFKDVRFHNLPGDPRQATVLADALQRLGTPPSQTVVLRDKDAHTKRIDFEFREALGRVGPQDTLVVFYSGHGYYQSGKPQLATYNAEVGSPGWRIERMAAQIRKGFRGRRLVVAIDCCASGSMLPYFQNLGRHVSYFASASGDKPAPEGWDFQVRFSEAAVRTRLDWPAVRDEMAKAWPGQYWESARG